MSNIKFDKSTGPNVMTGRPEAAFQQYGYDNNSLSSAEAEAVRIVKWEKTNWETAFAYITEKVAFNMRQVIRQCRKNYWGVFDEPTDPSTGRDKIWEHLTKTFVDYVVTAFDLDTKDINFRAKNPQSIGLTSVVRAIVKNALDEIGFGEILDIGLRQLAIDGTIVWKTGLRKDGKLKLEMVDLLNFYIDPTADSIADAESVIERIVVSIDEFHRLAKKDNWRNENIEGRKQVARYDTIQNPGWNTNSDITYVELYKRVGLAKEFIITGNLEDTNLVPMTIITSGTYGSWYFHYAERLDDLRNKGYEEAWMTRVHGRWYGEGVAERLLAKQLHFNILSNIQINKAYVSQLGLFLVRRGAGITPQQLSKLAANGAISVTNLETDIKQMPMEENSGAYYTDAQAIYQWAQRYTGATDVINGEQLPASTPATNAAIQNQSAKSRFTLIKEGVGMMLQRWLKSQALPNIFSQVKLEDLICMHLDADELAEMDEHLVNTELGKQLQDLNDRGVMIDPQHVQMEQERAMARMQKYGMSRYVKLLHTIDVTEYDVEPYITNEELDKAVILANLNQTLQTLTPLVQVNPSLVQSMMAIIREELDLMGLDSSQLKFSAQQPQQQQQQGGGQNPQSTQNSVSQPTQPGGNAQTIPRTGGLSGLTAPALTAEPNAK